MITGKMMKHFLTQHGLRENTREKWYKESVFEISERAVLVVHDHPVTYSNTYFVDRDHNHEDPRLVHWEYMVYVGEYDSDIIRYSEEGMEHSDKEIYRIIEEQIAIGKLEKM